MSEEWRAQPRKPRGKAPAKTPVAATSIEPYSVADWKLQIKLAEKRNDKWEKRCDKIIKRYRSEHMDPVTNAVGSTGSGMGMNVLWSNVQTLQPCVYGRQPVPICERRFLDKDVTGRVASQILERGLRYEMSDSGFHDTVEQAVLDYLLPGRGVAWLRYEPVIGQESSLADRGDDELSDDMGDPAHALPEEDQDPEAENRDGDAPTDETPAEKLLSASTKVDYVHWRDFFHAKARFWRENEWIARRLYKSRQDCIDDFGDEKGNDIPLEMSPENDETKGVGRQIDQHSDSMRKAIVFEIWHKPTRKVYTIAQGYGEFCEEPRDDPLNLEGFFPCPKPLFATMTNDTLEPVPDYVEYQDQAIEIDNLTNRMSLLITALKVAGVYDASVEELAQLLDESLENKLIPVSSWPAFATKGGLASAISFMPIKEVVDVLNGLTEARDKIKQDMFEITGLADVIRGQSDPRETAAAVQTKGRWGSLRLQARQQAVARFCRDIICMMGEIMSEHYPPQVLIEISGAMYDEGIGDPAPEPPTKPPMQPTQNPMLGHNGGPPMSPGGPTMLPGGPPPMTGGAGATPMGAGMPMVAGGPPTASAAPLQPPPQTQYAVAMQQYQMQMAAHEAEKMQLIEKAIDLLRQDKLRGFRIDIETDSTVQSDANEEKESRTEFIKAVTQFLEESFKIGQMSPDAVPMLGKMLLFGVRGFRAGRDLESTIEEFVDKAQKDAAAKASAPPPPNPELQKQQLELQGMQAKSQAEIDKAKIDAASSQADNQREIEQKQLDMQLAREQMQMDMAKMQQEGAIRQAEYEAKMRELSMKMEMMQQDHVQQRERMNLEHSQHLEKLRAEPKEKAA
jgi:hypothetical protein